ncbi:MAG: hypothetical protein K2Y21_00695 [Phycisphaerales bacterium]|nr:hypothetical protein [Phycisphaerales bacterium]
MIAPLTISAPLHRAGTALRRIGDQRTPLSIRGSLLLILFLSPIYGLAMGASDPTGERAWYMVYSALKMPLMIDCSAALCLPGFFTITTVLGLRDAWRDSIRAIALSQAAMAATLASLAPVTLFIYANGVSHRAALLTNGGMFLLAAALAQVTLWRHYRPLLNQSRRHWITLAYWLVAYIFVGIQTGWMLRPFIGTPGAAPTFFRDEPFSNAYVVVWNLVFGG